MSHFPFVKTVEYREVVTSTSDVAKELVCDAKVALPLLVWAKKQTAGRGREGRTWWSDEGSLTFTLVIDPAKHALRAEHEPRLALATAVAVVDALVPVMPGKAIGIRWPNDVEVEGRKLAGILPERVETLAGPRLLIGVGLNVRTRLADAPPEIQRLAIAIEELQPDRRAKADPEHLLRFTLGRFEEVLPALAANDPALAQRWNALDCLAGRWVQVSVGRRIVAGLGLGIDETGGLRLVDLGEQFTIHGGHILRDEERSD